MIVLSEAVEERGRRIGHAVRFLAAKVAWFTHRG
jgi:hypothetical protein